MNRHPHEDLNRNQRKPAALCSAAPLGDGYAAYKDLSANARSIYEQIKRRYNGSNNGLHCLLGARAAASEIESRHIHGKESFDENSKVTGFIVAEQARTISAEKIRPQWFRSFVLPVNGA